MRGWAAPHRANAQHILALELDGLAGAQIVCDDDAGLSERAPRARPAAAGVAHQALADVLQVCRPGPEILVLQREKHLSVFRDRGFHPGLRRQTIGKHALAHGADELLVLEEHQMGLEDRRFLRAHLGLGHVPQFVQLLARLLDRGQDAPPFIIGVAGLGTLNYDLVRPMDPQRADRDAGRGGQALDGRWITQSCLRSGGSGR